MARRSSEQSARSVAINSSSSCSVMGSHIAVPTRVVVRLVSPGCGTYLGRVLGRSLAGTLVAHCGSIGAQQTQPDVGVTNRGGDRRPDQRFMTPRLSAEISLECQTMLLHRWLQLHRVAPF